LAWAAPIGYQKVRACHFDLNWLQWHRREVDARHEAGRNRGKTGARMTTIRLGIAGTGGPAGSRRALAFLRAGIRNAALAEARS
jgi:hypothetical protein